MIDQEKIGKINAVFRLAEQRCKVVESRTEFLVDKEVRTGLLIPTINQLRYAGHHLLAYLTTGNISDLDEAESHSTRALYDAYQAELLFYLRQFKAFQDSYDDMVMSETIAQYIEWQDRHEEVQTVIRTNFEAPDRGKYFEILSPHIEVLNKIHKHLPRARENLNKKRKRERWITQISITAVALAVIAIGIALAAWRYPDLPKELWPSTHASTVTEPATKNISPTK
ncbi:MAG TPA: hypothetical protein VMV33_10575 [Rhodocyclaceae bacterium]|nr:hypothetical protein [Rhodocyclaceae bacterium]